MLMFYYTSLFCVNFNDQLIPHIYLLLMLNLLIVFSALISFQVFQSIKLELSFNQLNLRNDNNYGMEELFDALKILIDKRLWFKSIKLIESTTNITMDNMPKYFNAIGFIYYNMNKYDLACLYYLKALSLKDNYLVALQNLAKVYEKKKIML